MTDSNATVLAALARIEAKLTTALALLAPAPETPVQLATASWLAWSGSAGPELLASITSVQLGAEPYPAHPYVRNADQVVVNRLAASLGCPSNDGWVPSKSHRQWSLELHRDGLLWHVTAVSA